MKFCSEINKRKLQLLPFYLIFAFIIVSLFQTTKTNKTIKTKQQKLKFCKLDVLHYCFYEPISAFTSTPNGTGFPETETDFEQWCFSLHDYVPYCSRAWMRQCGQPTHEAAFNTLILKPFQQSIHEVCSNQTARSEFLYHTHCMVQKVKLTDHYRNTCVRHFQGDFELAGKHKNFTDYFRASCCAYNSWERCIVDQLSKQCGTRAGAIFATFIRQLGFHFFASFCPEEWYNPKDENQCPPKLYRAPDEYIPQGPKSTSFFSAAFAVACPNAAYGVNTKKI